MKISLTFSLPILLTFMGCQREEITSQWVPKDVPFDTVAHDPHDGHDHGPSDTHEERPIEWKLPAGWKEAGAQDMRVGSFSATGSNGQLIDISVIPLSGMAGGLLSNINRWRGQIQLPPIAESDLKTAVKNLKAGPHTIMIVDIVSTENLIDNKFKKRIVTAMLEQGARTWFIKMTGEDKAVAENNAPLEQFLSSLKLHD